MNKPSVKTIIHEAVILVIVSAIGYVVNDLLLPIALIEDVDNIYVIVVLGAAFYLSHFYPGTFAASAFMLFVMFIVAAYNDVGCGATLRGEELMACNAMIDSGEIVATFFGFKLMVLSIMYFIVVLSGRAEEW